MRVPLVDLKASLEPIKSELFASFESILDGMQLFLGPNVQAFEQEFADYSEVAHGIGVSNGTDALSVALRALGIGPGDEVILPSHTFFATAESVVHVGARPVLADVEPVNLTIDVSSLTSLISPATKAIVPVHLYGHPVDMDPLLELARKHDLVVVEDCAQAHGARYKGRRCGSMGDAAAYSFYFTKNLGAFGEAGFVATPHAEVAERVRLYRHHGHVSKSEHHHVGYNLRMDELQAAVLRLKLRSLDQNNERRRAVAARYDELLKDSGLQSLVPRSDSEAVYHLYPVRVQQRGDRDGLRSWLDEQGIGTGIHYPLPIHQQKAMQAVEHRAAAMPVTEAACHSMLSLPMYPELTEDQVLHVAKSVMNYVEGRRQDATAHSE